MIEDLSLLSDDAILGRLETMSLAQIRDDPEIGRRVAAMNGDNYAKVHYVLGCKHREDLRLRIARATDA